MYTPFNAIIRLRKNGREFIVDRGDVVMQEFEKRVVLWNTETSGWDERHAFWSVEVVEPGTDPDLPTPAYLGGFVS